MSWTLTKNIDAFAGPGEIKRREVVGCVSVVVGGGGGGSDTY